MLTVQYNPIMIRTKYNMGGQKRGLYDPKYKVGHKLRLIFIVILFLLLSLNISGCMQNGIFKIR